MAIHSGVIKSGQGRPMSMALTWQSANQAAGPCFFRFPFHDHEPRGPSVSRLPISVAGLRLWFIEECERQILRKQLLHVGRQRAMPVLDADTRPFHPLGKLLQIAIDRIMQVTTVRILDPSVWAGRDEAVEIRDQQRAFRLQNANHFLQSRAEVRNVDEGQMLTTRSKVALEKGRASALARR